MRLHATVTVRKWGGSHGFILPVEIVRKLDIEAGEILVIRIEKPR